MPKIEAATVAEHRALRERAVIDAAVGILATEGAAAVTPGAVARETGLARTSVYQYFPSTGALLGAALVAMALRREKRLRAALDASGTEPRERIAAYVRTTIHLAEEATIPTSSLETVPADVREELRALEARTQQPLREAVGALGARDTALVTALVHGTLRTATAAAAQTTGTVGTVGTHHRADQVAQTLCDFVLAGVEATAR